MQVKAPAKINWTLRVLGRRDDGFHNIESWFVPLSFADIVEGVKGESKLMITGPCAANVPDDDANTITQAEERWRIQGGVAPNISWNVSKEIPSGAGLGGGSADAAAALQILQHYASKPLSDDQLGDVALKVGSDVPFFLNPSRASLRGGRGEYELGVEDLPVKWVVLARPDFQLSTAKVYAHSLPVDWIDSDSVCRFPESPKFNQLEHAANRFYPGLQEFSARLRETASFQMTGSGSVFFWAASQKEKVEDVLNKVESFSAWTCVTRISLP